MALGADVVTGTAKVRLSVQLAVVVVDHEGVGGDRSAGMVVVLDERVTVSVPLAAATPARATASR